jgi:hypothetical protein
MLELSGVSLLWELLRCRRRASKFSLLPVRPTDRPSCRTYSSRFFIF